MAGVFGALDSNWLAYLSLGFLLASVIYIFFSAQAHCHPIVLQLAGIINIVPLRRRTTTLLILFCSAQAHYHPVVFPWLFPVMQISLSGSIWSTVSVSVERFLSVVQFRSRYMCIVQVKSDQ